MRTDSFLKVEITNATATVRVTDWTFDIDDGGVIWVSEPTTAVEFAKESGGFDEDKTTIALPISVGGGLFETLAKGEPVPDTTIVIQEVVGGDTFTRFRGKLNKVRAGEDDDAERIRIDAMTLRGELNEVQLGITCDVECAWGVGDNNCKVDMAAHTFVGTVTNIAGRRLTISWTAGAPNYSADFVSPLTAGVAQCNGVGLTIQQQVSDTEVVLAYRPPLSWLNEDVAFTAGCDGSLRRCRGMFDNEARFCGLGYSMPNYHPVIKVEGYK